MGLSPTCSGLGRLLFFEPNLTKTVILNNNS